MTILPQNRNILSTMDYLEEKESKKRNIICGSLTIHSIVMPSLTVFFHYHSFISIEMEGRLIICIPWMFQCSIDNTSTCYVLTIH